MSKRSEQKLMKDMHASGLMFQHATPSHRYTSQWRHDRKTKKSEIIPAIRFYVIAPLTHALGKAMNDALKAKAKKAARK